MTPAEVWILGDVFYETERQRQKEEWRRAAFLGSIIINMSQKISKVRVRPEQLINLSDEMQEKAEIDIEKMREESRKIFQFHKSKFWGELGGTSLDKVKICGEN